MRDHRGIIIDEFNGLFKRGDPEACPRDHFTDCNNVQFIESGFETRDGIDVYLPYRNVLRIYTYVIDNVQSLLVLDTDGNFLHTGSPTPFLPILVIPGCTDFAFVNINGRAYISPHDGVTGMQNQVLYVYLGDGSTARPAGGEAPTGSMVTVNSGTAGNVEAGIHIFGVVFETNTGNLTPIGPTVFPTVTAPGGEAVDISGVPVGSSSAIYVARHIVATKLIDPALYTGDTTGYQFFFVPNGTINDNVGTTIQVSFFDTELLDDASHLLENFEEIPAGVFITTYHDRLVIGGEFANPTIARVSAVGEPEAISQVDGLIESPKDGLPLSNGQEYRDILYLFKKVRTLSYSDNGDVPSSWPLVVIDQGIGCPCHGIATVLDSGGINIEYLIVADFSGVMIFDGVYRRPELSWKVRDLWLAIDRDFFTDIQIYNDSISQFIYITLPSKQMLYADYSNGLDPKNIRWTPWTFDIDTTTITLINTNTLIIGSDALAS